MEVTTTCKYMNTSTDLVYKQMLDKHIGQEIASVLKKTLPTKSLKYDVENNEHGIISVEYKYRRGSKEVLVEVQFEGGMDSYKITKQNKKITLTIINSAD